MDNTLLQLVTLIVNLTNQVNTLQQKNASLVSDLDKERANNSTENNNG